MFQIQSQLSTLCAISSAYAFYNAYLTDDIDGVLLDSEKIALEAAHFKVGGSASRNNPKNFSITNFFITLTQYR